MEVDIGGGSEPTAGGESTTKLVVCGVTCLPQRAALLKSMLNFLKKAIQGWESHKEQKSQTFDRSLETFGFVWLKVFLGLKAGKLTIIG
jgi:hypothetical protein